MSSIFSKFSSSSSSSFLRVDALQSSDFSWRNEYESQIKTIKSVLQEKKERAIFPVFKKPTRRREALHYIHQFALSQYPISSGHSSYFSSLLLVRPLLFSILTWFLELKDALVRTFHTLKTSSQSRLCCFSLRLAPSLFSLCLSPWRTFETPPCRVA